MFNWRVFLKSRGIPFHASGPHELVVHCPFCGEADTSHHLSISTRGRGWRCLRNPAHHHGKKYAQLLVALVHCSEEHARELLGENAPNILPTEDEFSETWRRQLGVGVDNQTTKPKFLMLPEEARPLIKNIRGGTRFADMFWDYLHHRGFTPHQIDWIAETYNLHYVCTGKWAYRLIVPIYDARSVLMTWTGRSILPDEKVRYKTLTSEYALTPPSSLLLGLPLLGSVPNLRCLVICEGPFDAFAVSALGHGIGIYGTCLFGLQVSEAQALLLDQLADRFDRLYLLLDPDARLRALGMRDRLPKSCRVTSLLEDLKDPAELLLTPNGGEWLENLLP